MVRKWSYLKNNFSEIKKKTNFLKKSKTFKVFRKTTKFKKFSRGITKVVKIKYAKRMFSSNYFILTQISKWWSFNYLQLKQIYRFSQSFGYSQILSSAPNFEIFNEINKPSDLILNLHLFSCSKKLVNRFDFYSKIFIKKTKVKNAKLSFVQTNKFESSLSNEIAHPLNLYFEDLTYHPYTENQLKNNLPILVFLQNALLNNNLHLILNIYKILILLSLINLKTNLNKSY